MPLPLRRKARIRIAQRARAENLGQQAFWVRDPSGKPSGMLNILDYELQDWTSAFDGATLRQVFKRGDQCPRSFQARELTDSEVELPRSLDEFPGFDQGLHERPRYGYSDAWQHFIAERAQRIAASQSAHSPQSYSTVIGDSAVAILKALHMALAFPAPSMLALGVSSFLSFATPPTFATRTGEPLFRPAATALFSFMQPPSPPKRALSQRPRRNYLYVYRPRHLATAISSQRCCSRAHSNQRLCTLSTPPAPHSRSRLLYCCRRPSDLGRRSPSTI